MAIRGNITDSDLPGPMKGKTLDALLSAIKTGDTYVNIHTPTHPNGSGLHHPQMGQGCTTGTATVNVIDTGNSNNTNGTATVTITDTGNLTKVN